MSNMNFYVAYNLNICSEILLPELIGGGRGDDVAIIFRNIAPSKYLEEHDFSAAFKVKISNKSTYLFLDDVVICKITSGNEIVINPKTGLDEGYLRIIILGPALTIVLHQRKNLIIHGSAVNINGNAVAFLGTNGRGKSTTLFALYKSGYPLVTDDILSVECNDNCAPTVDPSYPRLKLRQDTMNFMQEDLDLTPKTHIYSEKYSYYVENFSNRKLFLNKIYVVEKGPECKLETLAPRESLMELIKSSYCYEIFSKDEITENLMSCSMVVDNTEIKLLKISHSFKELPNLIKIIEEDNK